MRLNFGETTSDPHKFCFQLRNHVGEVEVKKLVVKVVIAIFEAANTSTSGCKDNITRWKKFLDAGCTKEKEDQPLGNLVPGGHTLAIAATKALMLSGFVDKVVYEGYNFKARLGGSFGKDSFSFERDFSSLKSKSGEGLAKFFLEQWLLRTLLFEIQLLGFKPSVIFGQGIVCKNARQKSEGIVLWSAFPPPTNSAEGSLVTYPVALLPKTFNGWVCTDPALVQPELEGLAMKRCQLYYPPLRQITTEVRLLEKNLVHPRESKTAGRGFIFKGRDICDSFDVVAKKEEKFFTDLSSNLSVRMETAYDVTHLMDLGLEELTHQFETIIEANWRLLSTNMLFFQAEPIIQYMYRNFHLHLNLTMVSFDIVQSSFQSRIFPTDFNDVLSTMRNSACVLGRFFSGQDIPRCPHLYLGYASVTADRPALLLPALPASVATKLSVGDYQFPSDIFVTVPPVLLPNQKYSVNQHLANQVLIRKENLAAMYDGGSCICYCGFVALSQSSLQKHINEIPGDTSGNAPTLPCH